MLFPPGLEYLSFNLVDAAASGAFSLMAELLVNEKPPHSLDARVLVSA